jgi:hypothetical protein
MIAGQTSLNNFYRSVQFDNPRLAALMSGDIITVSIYGLTHGKTGGQEAANNLRRCAIDLPVIQQQVLEGALTDLGYS